MIRTPVIRGNMHRVKTRQRCRDKKAHAKKRRQQTEATFNLERRKRGIAFSYRLSCEGPLSFLFEAARNEGLRILNSRKKVSRARRKTARNLLRNAEEIMYLQHKGEGGAFVVSDPKLGEYVISIRENDAKLFKSWYWVSKRSIEEQVTIVDLVQIYPDLSLNRIKFLLNDGEVSFDTKDNKRIFLSYRNGLIGTEIFDYPDDSYLVMEEEPDQEEPEPDFETAVLAYFEETGTAA